MLSYRCWVQAKLDTKFSIHVGYDGTRPSYPGIGALSITVFFDGIRVSDMFITPESLAACVQQKLARRAEALQNQPSGKKLSEEKLDELEASIEDGEEIPGATEIVGCPSNKGVVRPFYFASRKVVGEFLYIPRDSFDRISMSDNDIHWGNLDSLGQISVEVRWAKVATGLPGSMKALYGDIWKLDEWIGRRFVGHKHRLVATVDVEAIDLDLNEEREAEGGYRFKSEPLDDNVYRFVFHYADEGVFYKCIPPLATMH
ncbi:hypothetical protein FRC10_005277 [Ceratobasidium sp. 414]|nr:hypothetical protein FRC10_005277 [Ceratobasidium sp. 414]